jgi:hypothetical protein
MVFSAFTVFNPSGFLRALHMEPGKKGYFRKEMYPFLPGAVSVRDFEIGKGKRDCFTNEKARFVVTAEGGERRGRFARREYEFAVMKV